MNPNQDDDEDDLWFNDFLNDPREWGLEDELNTQMEGLHLDESLEKGVNTGIVDFQDLLEKSEIREERSEPPLTVTQMGSLSSDLIRNVEFIKLIGSGCYGNVYLVLAETTLNDFGVWKRQDMACKIPYQGYIETMNELSVLQNFTHKHICNLFDVIRIPDSTGITDAVKCLFLEYCHGDLKNVHRLGKEASGVRNWCFSERLSRHWFRHIIRGLAYLHSNGVVHCDVKEENILYKLGDFSEDTYVSRFLSSTFKLTDFGMSNVSNINTPVQYRGRISDLDTLVRVLCENGVTDTKNNSGEKNLFNFCITGQFKSYYPQEWQNLSPEMRNMLGRFGYPPSLTAAQIVIHPWCQYDEGGQEYHI